MFCCMSLLFLFFQKSQDVKLHFISSMPRSHYTRRYRRKQRRSSAMRRFTTPAAVVPTTFTTVLRYTTIVDDIVASGGGVNAPARYVFRLNSCYDPDYTGIGRQPCYFDLLIARYGKYVVTRNRVTVRAYMPATSSNFTAATGYVSVMSHTGSTNPIASAAEWLAARDAGSLTWKKYLPISANGESGIVTVKQRYTTWKVLGYGSQAEMLADVNTHGTSATNPANVAYLSVHVAAGDPNQLTTTWLAPCLDITLEQEVIFTDAGVENGWDA